MVQKAALRTLVTAGLLCAIGIIIPTFSPVKILLEPASFTLASHVPVFIAMFISPTVAVAVALGTTLGFLLGGFPLVIVLRALTHVVFALVGAYALKKRSDTLQSVPQSLLFSLLCGILHAVCEVLVVMPFYFGQGLLEGYYQRGFFVSVVLLVGVGTVVHSMVDFSLAMIVWRPLRNLRGLPR